MQGVTFVYLENDVPVKVLWSTIPGRASPKSAEGLPHSWEEGSREKRVEQWWPVDIAFGLHEAPFAQTHGQVWDCMPLV